MAATAAEIIKADQEHLIHPLHHPIDHAEPMIYVRGKGATIEMLGGERYIDGLAGLWNVNVGHGRAELAEAAAAQMKDMAYFSAYAGSSNLPAVQLAEKLVGLAYDNMEAVFFTCGGAESNESAFKTARFYWKARGKPDKFKVIARQNAYHGVTQQAMSATGMAAYWKMFEPRVPGFVHIPTCYPYRQQDSKPGETAGQTAARLLDEAISREGQETVAAFIAEPIHGGGGVLYPDDDYFRLVREVCTKREVLFISDEVMEDKASKRSFAADKKIGPRIQQEMTKRGVITRVRPTSGAHPATADIIMFAPALVITEAEVDRLVSVTRDAVKSVLGV